ncbi:sugar transferase [Pseudonocardia sp. TRM90224]|uniref:sugar transferase n=1 Tax=Pseudonocardia sp. TRM90224 TaxID=2812678 RepID=UPI001E2E8676|nr:sugar transferase [Pseudonocardia sp. TRM90224]
MTAVSPLPMVVAFQADVTPAPELHPAMAEVEAIAAGEGSAVEFGPANGGKFSRAVKRGIDITGALVGLLLTLPVLLAVAIAVRMEGGPGVIFRQHRVGQGGEIFTLFKFRSLKPVADEGDVTWNIDRDNRLGRVGRFIRATSVDELPQLVNVLIGDMSLVGPRPERPFFVDQFSASIPGYAQRHRVPVGLTGLAVVKGLRGDTSIPDRAKVDNDYANTWSLWLDIQIMLKTVRYLISH